MKRNLTIPIISLLIISAASLWAFPRLSIEHAEPCKSCHFAPSGSGARTEYGNFTTAFNELTLPQTKKLLTAHYRKPRIGEALILGFDMRYLLLDDGRIFRMQTDGFLTVEPLQNMYYHLRIGANGVTENYALLTFADNRYSARFGTLAPAFGLRNEDHNSFNRSRTGNGPAVYLDGFSMSAEVKGVNLIAEGFNPAQQSVINFHAYRPGTYGPLGYIVGGSYRITEEIGPDNFGIFPHAKAVFGGVSWDRLTLMGEMDMVGKGNDQYTFYGNLTTRLEYGVYVVGEYNFHDANRRIESGADEFLRFSLDFYPMPFVQIRPSYTTYTRGPLDGEDQFFVLFHVGY
ncbi:MAG: hypothetical protein NDJ18_06690 [candidate division Zixibacteria bacterium]|nr:hypothetical protein [candidate division Zixibacteria bacterium]